MTESQTDRQTDRQKSHGKNYRPLSIITDYVVLVFAHGHESKIKQKTKLQLTKHLIKAKSFY